MTKKVDTWMPLLVDKYLGDTTHLSTEQHGAYLLLLMTMWKKDGHLSADESQLASISRLGPAKWRAYRGVLLEFFTADGDYLTQKRLAIELVRAKKVSAAKAQAGAEGASKRWGKDGTANGKPDGKPDSTAIANGKQNTSQTGTPIPIPSASQNQSASGFSAEADALALAEPRTPTPVGQVGKALRRAGFDMTRVSLTDPRLLTLLDQGATPEEFEGAAIQAVKAGKGFPWLLGAVSGRRADAAAIALAPKPRDEAAENAARTLAATAQRLAEEKRHGEEVERQRLERISRRQAEHQGAQR